MAEERLVLAERLHGSARRFPLVLSSLLFRLSFLRELSSDPSLLIDITSAAPTADVRYSAAGKGAAKATSIPHGRSWGRGISSCN